MNIEQGLIENLQDAIDKLAPARSEATPLWISTESKRDATGRRYDWSLPQLLQEFMHICIRDAVDGGKDFWREMRNLGMIPKASNALHGFIPDELNEHFLSIAMSSTEIPGESLNYIEKAALD